MRFDHVFHAGFAGRHLGHGESSVRSCHWLQCLHSQSLIVGVGVIFSLLSGCGYQFVAGGPGPVLGSSVDEDRIRALQASAPSLVVLAVKNNSFEPNVEGNFTDALRREFAAGSGARLVSETEVADLQLFGVIDSVSYPSLSFSQTNTFESRATVRMTASVQDLRTKQIVWKQQGTASSEFFVTDDLQFNQVLQRRAVEQAGEFLAGDFASRFLVYLESTVPASQDSGKN